MGSAERIEEELPTSMGLSRNDENILRFLNDQVGTNIVRSNVSSSHIPLSAGMSVVCNTVLHWIHELTTL
jgi:hypothetical protein